MQWFLPGDNVTHTSTGFVKYLKVNGKILWQQDIGEDDGGWQRIEYPLPGQRPLADYLCTDDGKADAIHGGCVSIVNDKIELGVMAVNDVNSVLVRGLNLFIANVYLNSGHNYLNNWDDDNENILKNGDFAEHNGSHVALVWDRINNAPLSYSAACYSPGMSFNSNKDWEVQSHEVRSGIFSNGVRIRALTPDNDRMIPGMVYPVLTGHGNAIITYHAITQEFNLQAKLPPSNYRFIQPSIDFTIKPNPSALGTTLTGSIQNLPADQSYQVSIYTPEGTLAYLGNGYTSEFTISKTLPAGVYYVKVWGKGFSSYKRIVVVG
ncbi:MAG: T9SS type A sorting domain-containing protein [Bacteroidetes bacterium]|nr:T9SS type A sorting domain-containing protein [Bacteroidota bacterium]